MKNKPDVRVCKNKKCQKVLPVGYKHRYCESCRIKRAETAKNALTACAAAVGSAALFVLKRGKK